MKILVFYLIGNLTRDIWNYTIQTLLIKTIYCYQ